MILATSNSSGRSFLMAFLTTPNPPSPTTCLVKMMNSCFCPFRSSAKTNFASYYIKLYYKLTKGPIHN